MAKTIDQLNIQASEIKEATIKGENTALRVGGLFSDIVDYLANMKENDVVLGPLLTALNNSGLLDPGDGQTLRFSILEDNWTYSSAFSQLEIGLNNISMTVASNYEAAQTAQEQLRRYQEDMDARYQSDHLEYMSWRDQTNTHIDQFVAALTVDGEIVSMSAIMQRADEIQLMVTDNKEASDIAFTKIFNVAGLDYTNPDQPYSASWIYQKKSGIYGAAASFDEDGNILQSSQLNVTIGGIQTQVTDNKNAADAALTKVYNVVGLDYSDPSQAYTASWLSQNKDSVLIAAGAFDAEGHLKNTAGLVTTDSYAGLFAANLGSDATKATIATYVEDGISTAYIGADKIKFDMKFDWTIKKYGTDTVLMKLDNEGDLYLRGTLRQGNGDGIRTSDDGMQRWDPISSDWVPMYAGRAVRYPALGAPGVSGETVTLQVNDDMVLVPKVIGNYTISKVVIPSGCPQGKVYTIRPLMDAGFNVSSLQYDFIVGEDICSNFDLGGGRRAELVLSGLGTKYWIVNFMSE